MSDIPILFPIGLEKSGFCVGWTEPFHCVAEVLDLPTILEANTCLKRLRTLQEWIQLAEHCGSCPVIIGYCNFSNSAHKPSVRLLNGKDNHLTYYHRHENSSMRLYSLHIMILDLEPQSSQCDHKSSAIESWSHHDFSSQASAFNEINHFVINQLNTASSWASIVNSESNSRGRQLVFPSQQMRIWGSYFNLHFFHASIGRCRFGQDVSPWNLFLKGVSATAQQVDVRAEQADLFLTQMQSNPNWKVPPSSISGAKYINFYNTIWLILNDIIIGAAFGAFLRENSVVLAHMLHSGLTTALISRIQRVLIWLDSWPAGLKLNTELSRFYSHSFIELVGVWQAFLDTIIPYSPTLIYAIGILSCGGMTIAISLLSDMLAILTSHIYLCYLISKAAFRLQLLLAASLWNLFRGKRFNVLRNRTDSWDYDIDQLLFGTMLFTLLTFLFPTVLAYYVPFVTMRLFVILLHGCMDTILAFMNHFPLFALTLKIKDPWRLPGGIRFALSYDSTGEIPSITLEQNQPTSFRAVFYQYTRLWSRLSLHYDPLRLIRRAAAGEYLEAIPRYSIRYRKAGTEN